MYEGALTKSNYKQVDSELEDAKSKLEESLTRVCMLALENDRLYSFNKRLKMKVGDLQSEVQQLEELNSSKFASGDAALRSKCELLDKENTALKEMLDARNQEIDMWRKKFEGAEFQLSKYARLDEEFSKL